MSARLGQFSYDQLDKGRVTCLNARGVDEGDCGTYLTQLALIYL